MAQANQLLRAARQATASITSPGYALSRSELAELVNAAVYRHTGRIADLDGHYVAKLERGVIRWPGQDYRRALREVLGAATDSELGFRRPRRAADAAPMLPTPLSPPDETERERLAWALSGRGGVDRAVPAYLTEVLVGHRHIEDMIGSSRMLPLIQAEVDLVEQLIRQARGEVRDALVILAAEYHEFAGRMFDYLGDHRAALYHEDRGMRAAQEADDANLVAAGFGLRSHLAWSVQDGAGTVALAEAGQRGAHRLSPGITGALAQMQARGHALQGETAVAERLIDRTEQLTTHAREHPEDEPWWTYLQSPDRTLFQRGVAYLGLSRHREAKDLFDQARPVLPASYRRDYGRFTASLALARAHDGDVTGAVTAGLAAMAIAMDTGSVYTIADLRSMRRVLHHQQVDRTTLYDFDEAFRALI